MLITYIGHSGFLVETGTANFIFDYYKGEVPELDSALPLVVFASHKHPDHYNPEILDWMEKFPDITYVLDRNCGIKWKIRECEKRGILLEEHLIRLKKNMTCEVMLSNNRELKIQTLRSTDAGVAFLISYDGKVIYHGGDLNCWQWEGETDTYNANMEKNFMREMDKLSGVAIDAAFVPFDSRQQEYMDKGMETFLRKAEPVKVFPMHFWRDYESIRQFCKRHPEYAGQVVQIKSEGEQFTV